MKFTQDKFEKFDELTKDLQIETAQNLLNRGLVNLTQTSKPHLVLFKPMVDVRKLLYCVVCGEHAKVQSMLEKDCSLIFKRGKVTDCSGREFESISAFEYVLWALDKHMWAAMIACIPSNEESRGVFVQLLAQYNKVNTDGVTYRLNGNTITEQHFDFENTIIKELKTQVKEMKKQVDSVNAHNPTGDAIDNWDAIDNQWREGVGGAQKLLPMHIVDEYCSDEPFYPVPQFTSQPKSSKQFYNWTTKKDEDWFNLNSKMGVDLAIYKGRGDRTLGCGHVGIAASRDDLGAISALCEVRTMDFIKLKSLLEERATLDNYHQVVPM
ncbi:TPA: F-box protein [Legionella pneumophila]|nr:F-box protein [Legionella pneumophila]